MFRVLRRKWLRDLLLTAALLAATAALVAAPSQAIEGAKNGLALCGNVIIPSLFPFFVLSSLVVDLGLAAYLGRALEKVMRPLFRVGGSCAAAVAMGFVGGYPVGARTALQLYQQGQCTRAEAERLLAFCNNSGPAFILGVVGAGVFGSGRVGLLLYLTHAAASILVGILFRFHGGRDAGREKRPVRATFETVRASSAFTGAVVKALQSTLSICAFVVFFSVVLELLSAYGVLAALAQVLAMFGVGEEWARRLVAGLLELSSGVSSLTGAGSQGVSMAAFMLGWAGISVHCQVLSFIGDSGLSVRTYHRRRPHRRRHTVFPPVRTGVLLPGRTGGNHRRTGFHLRFGHFPGHGVRGVDAVGAAVRDDGEKKRWKNAAPSVIMGVYWSFSQMGGNVPCCLKRISSLAVPTASEALFWARIR